MEQREKIIFDYPIRRLRDHFNLRADRDHVALPETLYADYQGLYEQVENFGSKLRAVIYSPVHTAVIDAGRAGFNLPHPTFLRSDSFELMERLHAFDPYSAPGREGGDVMAEQAQIDGFFSCFAKATDITEKINDALRSTDYITYFRYLKNCETPYTGPSCVFEAFDMRQNMVSSHHSHIAYLKTLPRRGL